MTTVTESNALDDRLAVKYERWDDMSDGYRALAARVASFQALAELVGVLPFTDWIRRAPDFVRKQMLVAKIQDEVGHGHVMARVAEDLGVPREKILQDFVDGKTKLLNIFHYDFETWEEIGPAALLMNSSAIVQFQSLDRGTYLPYARALKKIEKEEGFHYHHALDLTHQVLREGNAVQRERVQTAFDTWFPRLLAYFGPPDTDTYETNAAYRAGIKVDSNDALRQRWIAKVIPVFQELGVHVDESLASFDVEADEWRYRAPDWNEVKDMLTHGGPTYQRWVSSIAGSLERNERYRRAALAA
ncbi:MAG: Phenylacetic acid catabolic protein [Solirubrobacterales bacterium]